MKFRAFAGAVDALGDNEAMVTLSTSDRARDGHVLKARGCDLTNFRANPILLFDHNTALPIGTCADLAVSSSAITARTVFAPPGISDVADTVRGLVKSGVIRGVSIGFEINQAEPIDSTRPRDGLIISAWELLEVSYVSIPADTGAMVTARAHAVTASRNALPVEATHEERRVILAALEGGENVTLALARHFVAEARRCGRDAVWFYRWQRSLLRCPSTDFERRQQALRELTRS